MFDVRPCVPDSQHGTDKCLSGKRAAVILYSCFPSDPRPRREAEALAAQGMEVDLICLQDCRGRNACNTCLGVNVIRLPLRRRRDGKLMYLLRYLWFTIWALAIVSFRSLYRRYSVVHVHNLPDWLIFAAIVPRLLGAKLILDLHDPMPELAMTLFSLPADHWAIRLSRWSEWASIKFCDLVITPNVAFQRLFSSRSCPLEKVKIVMNTPHERIFNPRRYLRPAAAPQQNSPQPFLLMYHGLLVARHGLADAVRALRYLRQGVPHAKLLIYGETTPYLDRILTLVGEQKLECMVEYRGWQPLEGIAEAISSIELGLIPNIRTPFTELNLPTRILEYLAMGKPVIVPRTSGILDYFAEDEVIYFEPGNPWDLAKKIEWAFHHPIEVRARVRRGQEIYKAHTWELEQREFINLVSGLFRPKSGKVAQPRLFRPAPFRAAAGPVASHSMAQRFSANS